MFVFGEEGRDLLTSEVALTVLQQICLPHHPPTNPPLANAVTRLNEGVELVLVPVANPDGRRIAEMGRRCDRTNANDVDVDRNWPSFWGEPAAYNAHRAAPPSKNSLRAAVSSRLVGKTHTSSSGTYIAPSGGTHPFSEPETRALRAIVEKVTPISYVSVRTGAVAVTVPWDCKPELLADAQRERLFKVTEGITAGHCTRCKMGTLWNVTGRVKCGTGVDYMYGTQHVQFVHSWHVYDVAAPRGDCFRKHNPISQAAYSRVTANWAHAVLNFTTSVHNWLTLESSEGLGVAERNASLSAAEASTRRSEALARGIPDPEKDESEKELGIGKAEPGLTYSKYKGKGGTGIKLHHARIFSWMVKDRNTSDMVGRNDMVDKMNIGPQLSNEKAAELEEGKLGMLTGWWGVWAAMLMLGAGFFVAKQYVFKGRARRSRFRSRTPTKNA